jgi:pyruvate,orthophosphate dikinase
VYRRKYSIPSEWEPPSTFRRWCSAALGSNPAPGKLTRDPASGERSSTANFCQHRARRRCRSADTGARRGAQNHLPPFAELEVRAALERHFKDVQDFEFTIQDGKLFMLQTRNGKRTGLAAVRFAVEMEKEKLIDWKTAITRVPADQLDQLLAPVFDRKAVKAAEVIAKGLPAGPGAHRKDLSQCGACGQCSSKKGERYCSSE